MSWTRTCTWWQALRTVSEELERRRDGVLPWRPEFADIFGDRAGLLRALRYRWELIGRAQEADWAAPTPEQVAHEASLFGTHRGLLMVLRAEPDACGAVLAPAAA